MSNPALIADASSAAPPAAPSPAVVSAPEISPLAVALEPATLLGGDTALVSEVPKPGPDITDAVPAETPKPEGEKRPDQKKPLDDSVEKAPDAEQRSTSDDPAPLPTYDDFVLPEGVTLEPDRIGGFKNILGEFEGTTKADHAAVQAFGQKLLNTYVTEVQASLTRQAEAYQVGWEKQKTGWKDDFLKDPDIGGNRFQTTLDAANKFIKTHGGSDVEQKEFRALLDSSGLGNHKILIRTLARAGQAMSEGRPLAAVKPVTAQARTKVEAMYGPQQK